MQKGISIPLVMAGIAAIAAVLVIFGAPDASSSQEEAVDAVGGATTQRGGFNVVVNANSTWDFNEYLCESVEDCLESPISGFKYASVSGGPTQDHDVVVPYADSWNGFEYLKIYVSPSFGLDSIGFAAEEVAKSNGVSFHVMEDSNKTQVLLIPTDLIMEDYVDELAVFTQR